ncbi:MAG: VPLPA-CTERM sorting domain-containing protein [Pseudomonadota bacterium]
MKKFLAGADIALGLGSGSASAIDIDWTFSGFFEDGSFISGTFTYQMSTDSMVNIDLELEGGSGGLMPPDADLTSQTPFSTANLPEFSPDVTDFTNQPVLELSFGIATDPTDLSPVLGPQDARVLICVSATCNFLNLSGNLTEGSLTGAIAPIPLPAGLPLLAMALGGLILVRRLS